VQFPWRRPGHLDMSEGNRITNWPSLVAGAMFDLKTPMAIVRGYLRMLENERLGPVTEKQRASFQEIQKATLGIVEILNDLDGLASLQGGGWSIDKASVSIGKLLSEVAGLPLLQHVAPVDIRIGAEHDAVTGVFRLLRQALAKLAHFIAWHQLRGERPLSIWLVDPPAASDLWIVLAATDQIQSAVKTSRDSLLPFAERQGPMSMNLPFAGAIVRAHGGELVALPTGVPGAVVVLPRSINE
jgi:light-regulated signal transduction histidine kinase (bacteriophytochrome)